MTAAQLEVLHFSGIECERLKSAATSLVAVLLGRADDDVLGEGVEAEIATALNASTVHELHDVVLGDAGLLAASSSIDFVGDVLLNRVVGSQRARRMLNKAAELGEFSPQKRIDMFHSRDISTLSVSLMWTAVHPVLELLSIIVRHVLSSCGRLLIKESEDHEVLLITMEGAFLAQYVISANLAGLGLAQTGNSEEVPESYQTKAADKLNEMVGQLPTNDEELPWSLKLLTLILRCIENDLFETISGLSLNRLEKLIYVSATAEFTELIREHLSAAITHVASIRKPERVLEVPVAAILSNTTKRVLQQLWGPMSCAVAIEALGSVPQTTVPWVMKWVAGDNGANEVTLNIVTKTVALIRPLYLKAVQLPRIRSSLASALGSIVSEMISSRLMQPRWEFIAKLLHCLRVTRRFTELPYHPKHSLTSPESYNLVTEALELQLATDVTDLLVAGRDLEEQGIEQGKMLPRECLLSIGPDGLTLDEAEAVVRSPEIDPDRLDELRESMKSLCGLFWFHLWIPLEYLRMNKILGRWTIVVRNDAGLTDSRTLLDITAADEAVETVRALQRKEWRITELATMTEEATRRGILLATKHQKRIYARQVVGPMIGFVLLFAQALLKAGNRGSQSEHEEVAATGLELLSLAVAAATRSDAAWPRESPAQLCEEVADIAEEAQNLQAQMVERKDR